jgi:hypothetical protein
LSPIFKILNTSFSIVAQFFELKNEVTFHVQTTCSSMQDRVYKCRVKHWPNGFPKFEPLSDERGENLWSIERIPYLTCILCQLGKWITLCKPFACLGRFMGLNSMQKEFFSHLSCTKFHNKLKPIIIWVQSSSSLVNFSKKNHFVYWKNLTLFSQMFFHRFNFNLDSSIRLIPGLWFVCLFQQNRC